MVTLMVLVITLATSLVDRLWKQRALLDGLFEQAPEALTLIRGDHRVVRVNREFTRVFGYTPQEVVGRRLIDLIVPDELRDEFQGFAELVAYGQEWMPRAFAGERTAAVYPFLSSVCPFRYLEAKSRSMESTMTSRSASGRKRICGVPSSS